MAEVDLLAGAGEEGEAEVGKWGRGGWLFRDPYVIVTLNMNETRIQAAIDFTKQKFASSKMTPNHALEVYLLLRDEFHVQDGDILVAAIMQNLFEDTDASKEEIEEIGSKRVVSLILELTASKNGTKSDLTGYAKLIKLADALVSLRSSSRLFKAGRAEESPLFSEPKEYFKTLRIFLDTCKEAYPLETSTVFVAMYEVEKELKAIAEESKTVAE